MGRLVATANPGHELRSSLTGNKSQKRSLRSTTLLKSDTINMFVAGCISFTRE